jgi:HYR domain-containing protein
MAALAAAPAAGVTAAAGTLNMNTSLALASHFGPCGSMPGANTCDARTDDGPFPGLGSVSASYTFPMNWGQAPCPSTDGKALAYSVSLDVAGKGAISVAVSEARDCVFIDNIGTQTQAFAVTGGTGVYAGASGNGTLTRTLGAVGDDNYRRGFETWQGTLTVPGLAFDLVPPKIVGGNSRTIVVPRHAKKVRVRFNVTANDDVDGTVPVTCKPRSGTQFRIGRRRVHCSAADRSANVETASFRITVRRHR